MRELFSDNLVSVVSFMAVVLAVLVVVMLYLLSQYRQLKSNSEIESIDTAAITLEESSPGAIRQEQTENNDEEVVAAIIAAICTYSGMSAEQFVIKSIKLVNSGNFNWRNESIIPE
ncbi:hypothetical protein [Clostridium thermarum]|uniref:hypothetical protein n=1 Tax=Clostridium thermarum TaxID=1716543 RepID=UPI001124AB4A|nr:hypothetical protein [Clostridium thermarum]